MITRIVLTILNYTICVIILYYISYVIYTHRLYSAKGFIGSITSLQYVYLANKSNRVNRNLRPQPKTLSKLKLLKCLS